jgi:hypothetical protein
VIVDDSNIVVHDMEITRIMGCTIFTLLMHYQIEALTFIDVLEYIEIILVIKRTRGVSHYGLAIYIKTYLEAKEELWKLKYFTMQKYSLQKILYKKPKPFKVL